MTTQSRSHRGPDTSSDLSRVGQPSAPGAGRRNGSHSVNLVVAALTELIITGQLGAGAQVVESDIAARLGVSRTPVREAIGQLVSRGLLVKENNRSARVHSPSLDDLVEIYDLRTLLECHIARVAAAEADRQQIAELKALERDLRAVDEGADEWFVRHAAFHSAILRCANRPRFRSAIEALQNQSEPYVRLVTKLDVGQRAHAKDDHRLLANVIARGDADGAAELTSAHLGSTVERVTRIFEAAGHLLHAAAPRGTLKAGSYR